MIKIIPVADLSDREKLRKEEAEEKHLYYKSWTTFTMFTFSCVTVADYLLKTMLTRICSRSYVHELGRPFSGSLHSSLVDACLYENLCSYSEWDTITLTSSKRWSLTESSQSNELLAHLPQFTRFLCITSFFGELVHEWGRLVVPAPVYAWFCKAWIAHDLNLDQTL